MDRTGVVYNVLVCSGIMVGVEVALFTRTPSAVGHFVWLSDRPHNILNIGREYINSTSLFQHICLLCRGKSRQGISRLALVLLLTIYLL